MSIPKIIHYCWFGEAPLTRRMEQCLESWRTYCPDYKIQCWNEQNAPIEDNLYAQQAYAAKKWAFVSDYVRVKCLVAYGGIYLDTDVELLKPLDSFLLHQGFLGYESERRIGTSLMAAQPQHPLMLALMQDYENRTFVASDGTYDYTTNVEVVTKLLVDKGLSQNNKRQDIADLSIYPFDFFSPKSLDTGKISITDNTCTIHHFCASWMPLKSRVHTRIAQLIGPEQTRRLKRLLGRN